MTTSTLVSNATAEALAEMMTENTGRHMLDSGNAYGRAWERNAGMTAGDFLARPACVVDSDGEITLDMFNFLNDRLHVETRLTSAWEAFDSERPDDSWGETLNEWLDAIGVPAESDGDFYSDARWEFNTYNFDGALINGTFQGVKFGLDGETYIALQIHGGCDVRGGYTKYKIFSGDIESLVLDLTSAYLTCPECDFHASYSYGVLDDYHMPKSEPTPDMLIQVVAETQLPEGWHAGMGCPLHKCALV